jgi:hypothetical protein
MGDAADSVAAVVVTRAAATSAAAATLAAGATAAGVGEVIVETADRGNKPAKFM